MTHIRDEDLRPLERPESRWRDVALEAAGLAIIILAFIATP